MKTLNVIQTLSKIAKVFSTIIFVCAIVGLCLCAVAACSLALGFEGIKIGGVTVESMMPYVSSLPKATRFAITAQGALFCVAAIILSKFAMRYFKRELADGTPFTLDGAKELLRLGILSICIPLAAQILASILLSVVGKTAADVSLPETDGFGSVAIGVALIVMSLLCKYGAQLQPAQAPSLEESVPEQDPAAP